MVIEGRADGSGYPVDREQQVVDDGSGDTTMLGLTTPTPTPTRSNMTTPSCANSSPPVQNTSQHFAAISSFPRSVWKPITLLFPSQIAPALISSKSGRDKSRSRSSSSPFPFARKRERERAVAVADTKPFRSSWPRHDRSSPFRVSRGG
jgi:hypothetical protein